VHGREVDGGREVDAPGDDVAERRVHVLNRCGPGRVRELLGAVDAEPVGGLARGRVKDDDDTPLAPLAPAYSGSVTVWSPFSTALETKTPDLAVAVDAPRRGPRRPEPRRTVV
jgi:hypothetical protein